MFEQLKKILEVSRERKVDVGVACDMARTEDKENDSLYKEALEFLREHWNEIMAIWNGENADLSELKEFCKNPYHND